LWPPPCKQGVVCFGTHPNTNLTMAEKVVFREGQASRVGCLVLPRSRGWQLVAPPCKQGVVYFGTPPHTNLAMAEQYYLPLLSRTHACPVVPFNSWLERPTRRPSCTRVGARGQSREWQLVSPPANKRLSAEARISTPTWQGCLTRPLSTQTSSTPSGPPPPALAPTFQAKPDGGGGDKSREGWLLWLCANYSLGHIPVP